jgi:glucan phosphoethanolaminetransferase (alkaline phosphatase superfamily)
MMPKSDMIEHPAASTTIQKSKRWLRLLAPAIFVMAQSIAFLIIFKNAIGGNTAFIVPHITLTTTWVASVYGLAILASKLPWRWTRNLVYWILSAATVALTTIFYLAAVFCLYGFRDLPTRGVITGYFTQLPAMFGALPFDRTILILICVGVLALLFVTITGIAWCLSGFFTLSATRAIKARPPFLIAPSLLFALFILIPPKGFINRFEPWLRSLHNRPLMESSLSLQSNPFEEASDQELEKSYPQTPIGKRLNVILIYIDGLRADVLQPYGGNIPNMPFMSKLVANGDVIQFPRVYASCSMTLCGLGTILQSRPAYRISPGNFSLPRLLRKQGYEIRYLLSGDHQHFLALKKYYEPYDFYLDGIDLNPARSNDDKYVFKQLTQLPTSRTAKKPQLIMLGLMSVHVWGTRNPEFRRWLPDQLTTTSFSDLEKNSTIAYRNNYHNGIFQADSVLSDIWHWLKNSGYLENSIILITSDHGESLGENGTLGHARSLSTPELLIPLWIHDPTGTLKTRNFVSQEDLAPTVLDLLDLPHPKSWTGISLLRPTPTERWHTLYYINSRDKFGLILMRNHKVLKYLIDTKKNAEQVYDLNTDLLDRHDISGTLPAEQISEFRRKLLEFFRPLLQTQPDAIQNITRKMKHRENRT